MINKPKYKIARRLGPGIFEKTQTQKFALREGRRKESRERPRPKSDFGLQMLEKQKARYSYGIGERQFAKYVAEALAKKTTKTDELLFERLETRLDNVAYRLHLAPTRQAARQMVSHNLFLVNAKKVNIPSFQATPKDEITIKPTKLKIKNFIDLEQKLEKHETPSWIYFDLKNKTAKILNKPKKEELEQTFNPRLIVEFYSK